MSRPPCPSVPNLQALLEEGLPGNEPEELLRHLETCADCRHTLETLAAEPAAWEYTASGLTDAVREEPALRHLVEELKRQDSRSAEKVLTFLRPTAKSGLLGLLGEYEVLEEIGQGGFGVVLKAYEPALHRLVAIKVLSPALAGSSTARKRFTREAQAAAAVCHDHIVPVYRVDEQAGLPYLVMQYVAGESLQQRLDRSGPVAVVDVVRIGLQTAQGLAAAHAQGLIHRDIKPANLLLENVGDSLRESHPPLAERVGYNVRVKISDFGLARMADDVGLTRNGVVAGTPEYMAPEQARGEPIDHRADLFSLGSVLYALCTGKPPFRGSTTAAVLHKLCTEAAVPVRELNPNIPVWLEELIARLLAREPGQRVQSAAEVATLLEGYLAHLAQPASVPVPRLPALPLPLPTGASESRQLSERPRSRQTWLFLAAGLLVVLLLGLGIGLWLAGAGQDTGLPEKVWKEEYAHSLQGPLEKPQDFTLIGPEAAKCCGFEKDGLRITVPAGQPGERPATGAILALGVKGDFEISVSYEVLQEPEAADAGDTGTRLTLGIVRHTVARNAANFSRKVGSRAGPQLVAWSNTSDGTSKEQQNRAQIFAARGKSGRLRLSRAQGVLSYAVREPGDKDFRVLHQVPFGEEDLREVRLSAATGGPRASLEVRFSDLRLRADALPRLPLPSLQPAAPPPTPRELPEHRYFPFGSGLEKQPLLSLFGPEADTLVKVDQGLRFGLPAERLNHDNVGAETRLRLRGDFTVALGYELLGVPNPAPPLGAGVALFVSFDSPQVVGASVTRSNKPNGPQFGANYIVRDRDGKEQYQHSNKPAQEPKGTLRLMRIGDKLLFSVAEGPSGFQTIRTTDCVADDVTAVRAVCTTGWQPFSLDVRLLDLDIRADQLPAQAAPEEPAEPLLPETPKSGRRGWLLGGTLVALALLVPLVLIAARRFGSGRPPQAGKGPARSAASDNAGQSATAPALIAFSCSACARKLKVKAELVGRKVKCSGCGKALVIPAAQHG